MSLVIAFDPSLSLTGFAVLRVGMRSRGGGAGTLVEAGLLRVPDASGGVFIPRLAALAADVGEVIARHAGDLAAIVVETPLTSTMGMAGKRSHTTGPIYGMAVGAVLMEGIRVRADSVEDFVAGQRTGSIELVETSASEWAKGLPPTGKDKHKTGRVQFVQSLYGPGLNLGARTVAGNVADAVLLGRWWIQRQQEASPRAPVQATSQGKTKTPRRLAV